MSVHKIYVRAVYEQLFEVEADTEKQAIKKLDNFSKYEKDVKVVGKPKYVIPLIDEDLLKYSVIRVEK